jgi:hypothetical protein
MNMARLRMPREWEQLAVELCDRCARVFDTALHIDALRVQASGVGF